MIINSECLKAMKELPDNSVESIVTDPPYGLSAAKNSGKSSKGGFMGKKWDYDVPSKDVWIEALRVLKPGGYLLAFAGTRTQHRMAVNIEDGGFEIRDMIAWVYGSGFPKSHNVGKAIDKSKGVVTEKGQGFNVVGGSNLSNGGSKFRSDHPEYVKPKMTTPQAKQWEGWGTALKPALEPITLARKPLSEKTVAENVLKWGTGGINIDGCRVGTDDKLSIGSNKRENGAINFGMKNNKLAQGQNIKGRFPANLIHDGSEEVEGGFPEKSSRFFYCAKASKKDRNEGLEGFEEKQKVFNGQSATPSKDMKGVEDKFTTQPSKNNHPTVKPTSLMQYLVRLITPTGGKVLDPFMGSGSTGKACKLEGFEFIGIEMDAEYCKIAEARIEGAEKEQLELI